MSYLEPTNGPNFRDTVPYPDEIPIERDDTYNDPTAVGEIEQAIIDGYKDDIAVKYAQFIRGKMYGADVRESIARFDLWLDVRVNSIDEKGNQINSDYKKIQKELEDFRTQFEIVISAQTIDGEVKLARHSLISGKIFESLKARLDYSDSVLFKQVPSGFLFVIEHDSEFQPDILVTAYKNALGVEKDGLGTTSVFGGDTIFNVPTNLSYDRLKASIEMPLFYTLKGDISIPEDDVLLIIDGINVLRFKIKNAKIKSGSYPVEQ